MSAQTDRRGFLQAGAVAGIGFWVAGSSTAADKEPAAAVERLNIACIGVGGKGSSDTDNASEIGNVVALCDIDDNTLAAKSKKFPKAKTFNDFRALLEKMDKDIDAVVVSTPDHTHAPAAAMALRLRKHVYCQKPLTHSVFEARKLRELAREYKVCTQMGNQGTANDGFRTSVELLRSGALGDVKEVHVWTNRPTNFWKQAPDTTKRPAASKAPAHVKWDLFLGPAPERPYAAGYHPFAWRGWRDFGTGALGDMACHTANMPFMGLNLGFPSTISAESDKPNPETYHAWSKITYQFPKVGDRAALTLTWYEGKKDGTRVLPDIALLQGKAKSFSDSGCLIVAEKATLYSPNDYGASSRLIGKDVKDIKAPEKSLTRRGGDNDLEQKKEWAEAIKKSDYKIALSNFDYAGMLTEVVLLGNAAVLAGTKLTYDGAKMTFSDSEMDKYLQREYRAGWKL